MIPSRDDDAGGERVSVIVAHFPENVGGRLDQGRLPGLDLVEAQMISDHVGDGLRIGGRPCELRIKVVDILLKLQESNF